MPGFRLYTALAPILALVTAPMVSAQSGGRFEEAKRQGLLYVKNFSFDKAAGKLEEVWEQDKSDPAVAENLALAYLNGADRDSHPEIEGKAVALMERSLAMGGRATFLVVHSHEKLGFIQGRRSSSFCTGFLTVAKGRLSFTSQSKEKPSEHTFDLSPSGMVELRVHTDNKEGAFYVKTREKTFNFLPRNWSPRDAQTISNITNKYLSTN